jgi:prenyltransferase beta subunit
MLRRLAVAVTLVLLALSAPAVAGTADPVAYVRSAQNADGGFGMGPAGASDQLTSGWAIVGLAASGHPPGAHALAYVRGGLKSLTALGDVERTAMAVHAAGGNPRAFGGRNLIATILAQRRSNGSFDGFVSYTAFAVFALRDAGTARSATSIRGALKWLEGQQNADGGFNVSGRGGASGADDTGYAVQALVKAGGTRRASVRRGAAYLAHAQRPDGGFGLQGANTSNAQSTAYAVQGLIAAGGNAKAVNRGLSFLRSLTEPNGLVRYSRTSEQSPVWVTAQALLALSRTPF